MCPRTKTAIIFLSMALSPFLPTPAPALERVVVEVLDGDTLGVTGGEEAEKLQLAGLDCPELEEKLGTVARDATVALALFETVEIEIVGESETGIPLARVFLDDGRQLNAELISQGLAEYDGTTYRDAELRRLENEARSRNLGIWGNVESWPTTTLEERTVARSPAAQQARPRNCIPRSQCCKVCSTGKACGNSCISRSYTCRKGRGCACNRSEIC